MMSHSRGFAVLMVVMMVVTAERVSAQSSKTLSAPFDADMAKKAQQAWAGVGKVVIENGQAMSLTLIPPGEYDMGSPEPPNELMKQFPYAKKSWLIGERPVHRVKITKPFYLGTYEVTLRQFLKFYHDKGYKIDAEKDGKGGWGYDPKDTEEPFAQRPKHLPWSWGFDEQTMDHPVVNVSWNDAKAFCAWLSGKDGRTYRLPTEAEWEYACRAGTTTRYWNGNDPQDLVSIDNIRDSTFSQRFTTNRLTWPNCLSSSDGHAFTAPVGSFNANPFGLYDMHGNAGEWCEDWYAEDYYAKSPADDPTGPTAGSFRVVRGGGWSNYAVVVRSASRYDVAPSARSRGVGFRVVLVR